MYYNKSHLTPTILSNTDIYTQIYRTQPPCLTTLNGNVVQVNLHRLGVYVIHDVVINRCVTIYMTELFVAVLPVEKSTMLKNYYVIINCGTRDIGFDI